VSLDVADGEFVALIRSSGAGKSSILRCVNGLVAPTSGEVVVDFSSSRLRAKLA
jgi:phosphonate transport system ATP-binding protein